MFKKFYEQNKFYISGLKILVWRTLFISKVHYLCYIGKTKCKNKCYEVNECLIRISLN